MKKRSKVLAMLLCTTMVFAAGCGGKADTKEEKTEAGTDAGAEEEEQTSESDEYLALIKEAYEQYNAEGLHGYKAESTSVKEDGSSETSTSLYTIDRELQQVLEKHIWEDWDYTSWYTKEGENEYYYTETTVTYVDTGEERREYYKVLSTGQGPMTYSFCAENEEENRYESSEFYDISNVNVTSEGEEELDGVQVQKFRVEYDSQWKGGEELTRESLMEEYEWTEEDIAQLEGMSDAIDAYVEESSEQRKKEMDKVDHMTDIVYLTSDDHKLVRLETEYDYGDEEQLPASKAFWNMSGKLNYMKDLISEGYGNDEALSMANEAYSEDTGMEEESPSVSNTSVTTYLTGDACEPIELPADAKELTWEQWENGDY